MKQNRRMYFYERWALNNPSAIEWIAKISASVVWASLIIFWIFLIGVQI